MTEKNSSQLKTGAIISYASIALNILAGLLYTPWMVHEIGQSNYGIFTLANSLISLFLIDFGLSAATSRYVAKYRVEDNPEGLNQALGIIYRLYILIDIVIFLVLVTVFFFIEGIYSNLTGEEIEKLKVVFCITSLYSLISFPCITFNGILNAYEQFIPLKSADIIQRLTMVGFTVIALLCGKGLYALVLINAACGLLSIAYKYFYVRRCVKILPAMKQKSRDLHLYKEVFGFSAWSTVSSLAQRLVFNITPTILGMVAIGASAEIALFGIVSTIEGYFYIITTAINGMFLARITTILYHKNENDELTSLAVKVGRFQYALNGLMCVGFALVGKEFMLLWMGEEYLAAYSGILLVVFPGLFLNSLQIANTSLIAQNLVKYQAFIAVATGVCNVVLSFVLASFWGVIGACISICTAYFVRLICTIVVVHRKTEINIGTFIKECYMKMSIPVVAALIVGTVAVSYIDSQGWLMLCIKALVITMIYGISIYILGLSKTERNKILKRL